MRQRHTTNGTHHLMLTGERRNGQLLVLMDGKPLWITNGQFQILKSLILGRANTEKGFVVDETVLYPKAVCLLRKAFSTVCGRRDVIQTGLIREYRLCPTISVSRDASFTEIPAPAVLSPQELQSLCRLTPLADAETN